MHKTRQMTRHLVLFAASMALAVASAWAADASHSSSENDLLAVLRSDAPPAEKAITCKKLSIVGSNAAVPDLARLLADAELASWARIALEAIPGEASNEALRNAAHTLKGNLLIGTVNSIGVRRDAGAVELLSTHLQDQDPEVASAAAVALGRIGNAAATKSLRQALATAPVKVRSAVAEGCVLCAEQALAAGKSSDAAAIYDEVRKADVPKQRVLEATRGAILARTAAEGVPLLLEQFRSPELGLFQIALSTAREYSGKEVDKALAEEMVRAKPERAALIVQAMADRKETVVLAAVLDAAKQGPKVVRLSAIDALGRVGNESCLAALLAIAVEGDKELQQSTKATLADLPDQKVDTQVIAMIPSAEGKMYPLLLEVVGLRRIAATALLIKALDHSDAAVRSAALTALGETIALQDLSILIAQTTAPKHAEDTEVARQALKAASVRMPDREACATELVGAVEKASSVQTKGALLQILGAVGGTKALAALGAAARGTEPELQDVSTRLLGEWMTEDAAPVLLDLVKTAPGEKYQTRALKAYIRIARQFVIPEKQRAEMCQKAFEIARQPAEKKMVLEVLKRYPSKQMLKLAIDATQTPEVKKEATEASLTIAQKLTAKGVDVKDMLSKAGLDGAKP